MRPHADVSLSVWHGAPLAIVDTNVLIGQWMTELTGGGPMHILDGMRGGALPFVVCEVLVAEYRHVLLRPKVQLRHQQAEPVVDAFLARLAQRATVLEPAAGHASPDPGDQMLWDLLCARDDLHLITIDKLLLKDRRMRGRVVTPEAFGAAWWRPDPR
jgi:predicted nucleic acid-binding protein